MDVKNLHSEYPDDGRRKDRKPQIQQACGGFKPPGGACNPLEHPASSGIEERWLYNRFERQLVRIAIIFEED